MYTARATARIDGCSIIAPPYGGLYAHEALFADVRSCGVIHKNWPPTCGKDGVMAATTSQTPAKPQGKPVSPMYYVHTVICLFIMFAFGQLPPYGALTPLGMNLIGIFLGVLYGWVFIEIVWPSLAGLLALMLIGGMKPVVLLNKSFGDPIVQMMFFIFVFCATINYYGLSKFISLWFISRKFVKGRPWLFTYVFMGSIFILGGLTSASPAAIIGWSILYGVCDVCGYKKGEGYPTMMVFGIVFAAQMGMSLIPFKQAALTVFSAYETLSGVGIDYGKYMLLALIICAICSVGFIIMGKYVFRPDMSKLLDLEAEKLDTEGSLNLDNVQRAVLVFLLLLVVLLLAPNFMPKGFFLTKFLRSIGNTGIVILLVTIMAAIKIKGKPMLNFKVMVDSGVTWGIVLLLAIVQPLTWAMSSPDTGITKFLMESLEPLFGGSSSMMFACIIGIVATILTQVMNNGAVGVALMPIVYSYCQASGANPALALVMVVMGVHLAFLTPAASASAALLHGNEWSDARAIWKTAPMVIAISWIIVAIVTFTVGAAIF